MHHPNALYRYLATLQPETRNAWAKTMILAIKKYLDRRYGKHKPFPEDAEDIFQRTFERLANAKTLTSGSELDADDLRRFFHRCCKYTILSAVNANSVTVQWNSDTRQRIRRETFLTDAQWASQVDQSESAYYDPNPEAAYINEEQRAAMLQSLCSLRQGSATTDYVNALLNGTFDAGQKTREIARQLGTSSPNVRKIRQRLQSFIERERPG